MHVLALTLLWSTLFRTTTASIQLPSQIPGHSPIEMPTLSLGTAGFNSTTVQQVVVDAYQAGFTAVHTAFDDAVLAADVYVPGPHMLVERQAVRSMTTLEVDRPALNLPDGQALHVGCVLQAPTVAV